VRSSVSASEQTSQRFEQAVHALESQAPVRRFRTSAFRRPEQAVERSLRKSSETQGSRRLKPPLYPEVGKASRPSIGPWRGLGGVEPGVL
jgi:hypothetical protein